MHLHAGHGHTHGLDPTSRVLKWSLVATAVYIFILVIVGFQAQSLALLSEAGHNVSDFLALILSTIAVYLHRRPPSQTKTFGYHRAGVLAAFINALSLVFISFYIFYEAAERLINPRVVQADLMMAAAVVGVFINGGIAYALWRVSRDVNIRSVFLHEIGDTASTVAVLIGGWSIYATGNNWIDPALSFGIAALILWSCLGIIRETLNILLEGMPRGLSQQEIAEAIEKVEGVNAVHDLHVWSIGSETHAMSCHIAIEDIPLSQTERIRREVNQLLRERFQVQHTTIQFEAAECDVAHGCVIPVRQEPGGAHGGHTHDHQHEHPH